MDINTQREGAMMNTREREQELLIKRTFDAPREKVWKAWTDPEMMKLWWGPKGFSAPYAEIDFRVGGKYLNCMKSPEGKEYWGTGVYRDIVPMQRIALTDSFADEKGNVVPPSHYGMQGEWPVEMNLVLTFEELNGKTNLTIHYPNIPGANEKDLNDMRQGWNESLDKLALVVEK